MKKSKAILMVVCAMLLVAASVMGTLAYLTSQASVTNTFSVGSVAITMDEAKVDEYGNVLYDENHQPLPRVNGNTYKLVPGHTYTKDPTIRVTALSEDCYIFAKIENGLAGASTLTVNPGWTALPGVDNVYYYNSTVSGGIDVVVFNEFTFNSDADPDDYANAKIIVTGYAIQADGFVDAADAWAKSGFGTPAVTDPSDPETT